MILEIVKTWRKQKVNHDFNEYSSANCLYLLAYLLFQVEIDKILRDVREIQKDYNAATETLGRSFAAADEAVYRATSTDPHAKACYKALAALHEGFGTLVSRVAEIGSHSSTCRELQIKIGDLASRDLDGMLERIGSDLQALRADNDQKEAGG